MEVNETVKCVGEGILEGITRVIVETDEENPVPIATIMADFIDVAQGYRARCRPLYKHEREAREKINAHCP